MLKIWQILEWTSNRCICWLWNKSLWRHSNVINFLMYRKNWIFFLHFYGLIWAIKWLCLRMFNEKYERWICKPWNKIVCQLWNRSLWRHIDIINLIQTGNVTFKVQYNWSSLKRHNLTKSKAITAEIQEKALFCRFTNVWRTAFVFCFLLYDFYIQVSLSRP